jgi:3-methylfumaryl-CoA hydratase
VSAKAIDLQHLRTWVGHVRTDTDIASVRPARLMAAAMDRPGPALREGDCLPPLWHWIYFLEAVPTSALGRDGHPSRGSFLPPVPLANRLWAGGRVWFEADIALGAEIEKRSQVLKVEHKQGRSGDLVFVTAEHEIRVGGSRAIREEHDIVYRDPWPPAPDPRETPRQAQHSRPIQPTTTTLFRYSALTFNGHRIHYDADYCRDVEGYSGLVIHGPLSATWLAGYAQELTGRRLKRFDYRGVRPAILGCALTLNAIVSGSIVELWTALPGGEVSMRAGAELA